MDRKDKIRVLGLILFFVLSVLLAAKWDVVIDFFGGGGYAFIEHHVSKSPEEIVASMHIPEHLKKDSEAADDDGQRESFFSLDQFRRQGAAPPEASSETEDESRDQLHDPATAHAYMQKAEEHERTGEYREAMEAYRDSLRYNSDNTEAYYRFAIIAFDLGSRSDAVSSMAHAVQREPDKVAYRITYARMLAQTQQRAEARAQLQEALRLDPGNRTASTILRTLER
ncbi:tetratricopeptide repeat protein [Desulfurispira natronophila]|uniref:Tetratricopeptide (TPR) repeat protein n=1 Tax=Desulfurispira natronophila TaxID=682562 RepID=A0A7W8DGQ3_9BACT|nr:tetratricopeptide repeat protein [Desulfurispira natronophila]MBB5021602.1 tetratricopeptide (TPR) repeat protein [Desulfurispira natronophila]